MSIAGNIRSARKLAGLKQADLALKAGVSEGTICNAERGTHTPDGDTLQKIAAALGTPLSTLIGEEVSTEAFRIGAMAEKLGPEDRSFVLGIIERLASPAREAVAA